MKIHLVACLSLALCVLSFSQVKQTTANLGVANVFTRPNQFTLGARLGPVTFLTLPAEVNGLQIYCSNCQQTNPCLGSGSGAMATGIAGAWSCTSGSGGGISGSGTLNQVGVWSGATSMTGFPSFTYNDSLSNSGGPFAAIIVGNPLLAPRFGGFCVPTASGIGYDCLTGGTGTDQRDFAFPAGSGTLYGTGILAVSATVPITEDAYGNIACPTCITATPLENCTSDQTGNSFPTVTSLANYFNAHWEFVYNTTTYINCQLYIPRARTGAQFVVDVYSADAVVGHTANIQTCDTVIPPGGNFQVGSLTCATPQIYTTTSTAYSRTKFNFDVQSALVDDGILVIKIGTSPTGTAPTSDIMIYPHFVL
jgi:hypothetical protein